MIVDYFYIFETLHNIPQEGQQLILSHENWKGYIIESNHHDYRHLIRTLEEWETIFREISKLPPSIQKKVKENENWIYYIIGGSNKNDPYDSSCRVKNREPYYTPLLNLIKFYQAEYPESPKLGSNSNVPTIKE